MSVITGKGTRNVTIELSVNGVRELEKYLIDMKSKMNTFCERLALAIAQRATESFANAIYDGDNDVQVTVVPTENGFDVQASGNSVCFIEFGSGVFHNNTGNPYPVERPSGIVGIGEYGLGLGKNAGWTYKGNPGTNGSVLANGRVFTRGNPANMCLWNAVQETLDEGVIDEIIGEVFGA